MKKKKLITVLILLLVCTYSNIYSQYGQDEIRFFNNSTMNVIVKLYPASMVFNGGGFDIPKLYSLVAVTQPPTNNVRRWSFNNAVYYTSNNQCPPCEDGLSVPAGNSKGFNSDYPPGGDLTSSYGSFGFGIYKLEIIYLNPPPAYQGWVDSVLIEFDDWSNSDPPGDLGIFIKNFEEEHRFTYNFCCPSPEHDIIYPNNKINIWEHGLIVRPKNRGNNFVYKDVLYPIYNKFNHIPLDSRRDCGIYPPYIEADQRNYFPQDWNFPIPNNDVRQGNLTLNLTLHKSVMTPPYIQIYDPNSYKVYTNQITIKDAMLTIDPGYSLSLTDYEQHQGLYAFIMRVKGRSSPSEYPGTLRMLGNSQLRSISTLTVNRKSFLYLERGSVVLFSGGSKIIVESGGLICFGGADIRGQGSIEIHGPMTSFCDEDYYDTFFQDSASLVLGDSVTWEIPSNITITFDGNVSCLKMNPHSSIKFGSNSKLILQNGAHLVADSAAFTSLDANSTWDGIYLCDFANDTITNCVIQNAANGINLQDKNYSVLGTPTVEISNCTFSNTTNTQLTNGIYVNNCSNVLIKGNNFTSTQLAQGFTSGIITEYCLPGSPVIVDNNIDKVLTGIFVVQSSPYIARNTITGVVESGKGIELDNSNGTIKYNIVSNFVKSYLTGYSSPYLLKNTFSGASETNIDLYNSSVPVMRPLNSGTTLSWLAGNNVITGSPSVAGISYQEESYPRMDSGFNKMNVGSSYYMSGEIPSSQDGELQAIRNYWTDEPGPENFAVTGGVVIYDPTFDGSSLPPTDYYDLNDIGFGLYDTVYVESLGDNPGADNLFMQAYEQEREHNYVQAISLYKQVITNYRNSNYAFLSLSRIFNCVEKKLSSNNEYQLLQNYMSQIRLNNIYHSELRELAEDFVIKTKVKQGLLQTAISDYEAMYQQNQNNHKGIHALINKECLIAMLNDSGDSPGSQNNFANLANHKLRLLSLVTGRDLTHLMVTDNNQLPFEYKLYQNYPNPFNPKTTIKYDLPKEGFVTFKVYDVLGKEIYSVREYRTAGTHQITLDGSNYASGLYFYRIESGSYFETKKMVLIK